MELPELPYFTPQQRKGLFIVAAIALAVGAYYLFLARGHEVSPALEPSSSTSSVAPTPIESPSPPQPSLSAMLVVDVAGKVLRPGVYSLPTGSRVIDAIKLAGGAKSGVDLTSINLAQQVFDGQQIVVGAVAPPTAARSTRRSTAPATPTGPVSINGATEAELETLPGIGPVTAKRIITYRQSHGPFASLEDLRKVQGIGPAKFAALHDYIRL